MNEYRAKGGFFILWKRVLSTIIAGLVGIGIVMASHTWASIAFGLTIALLFYGYLMYLRIKITHGFADIEISLDEKGLCYKGINFKGFQMKHITAHIPYETIRKIEIKNIKTGPVRIETINDSYLFWDHIDISSNTKLIEEIQRRLQNASQV